MQIVRLLILFCVLLCGASLSRAQNAVVEAAKRATALVVLPNGEAYGSAFCIREDGIFVTNQHVIEDLPANRRVNLILNAGETGQKTVPARIVKVDEINDLALLRTDAKDNFPMLPLGEIGTLAETQSVLAVGFPFGTDLALDDDTYPSASVNLGRITALRRSKGELKQIQTDAAINPGNSGGPLVNEAGKVVGVVFAGFDGLAPLNFAVPVSLLSKLLSSPQVKFEPVAIDLPTRTRPRTWTARIETVSGQNDDFDLRLKLSAQRGDERTYTLRSRGNGEYAVDAPALPPNVQSNAIGYTLDVRRNGELFDSIKGVLDVQGAPNPAALNTAPTAPSANIFGTAPASAPNAAQNVFPEIPNTPNAPQVDTGWLGGGGPGAANAPQPQISGREVASQVETIEGLRVRRLTLNASEILANAMWSSDGKYLYLLEKSGLVRKIDPVAWREERTIALAQNAHSMTMAQGGLLVGTINSAWLLDANSLAVKGRIAIPNLIALASSSALNMAYASVEEGERLSVVDLATGKIVNSVTPEGLSRGGANGVKRSERAWTISGFGRLAVTPDGKYLFAIEGDRGGNSGLHRFRLNQIDVIYEEAGPSSANAKRIELSPDGAYVALPAGGGNTGRGYTTNIYAIANLSAPVVAIESGAYPQALGFDRAAGKIYAQNHDHQLLIFAPGGQKEAEYKIVARGNESIRQILPHPQGRRVLLIGGRDLPAGFTQNDRSAIYWVEIPQN